MKENKDFLRHFRVGGWALAGVVLVIICAILIS
jgi:hypothetical protein